MNFEEAIKVDHQIINDIRARYERFGAVSDRQIELVVRLAKEATETKVQAPLGRRTFTGEIQSAKWRENGYGEMLKITVRVATPGGVWRAWGTCPAAVVDEATATELVGRTIQLTATLYASDDDESFVFFKRPRGTLIETN